MEDDMGIGEKELYGLGTGLKGIGDGVIPMGLIMFMVGEPEVPNMGTGDEAPIIETGDGEDRGEVLLLAIFVGVGLLTFLILPCLKFCSLD